MIKCQACPGFFQSSQEAIIHFKDSHAVQTCQLCKRAGAAKASPFCPTCKAAFPDLTSLENIDSEIRLVENKLTKLKEHRRFKELAIKTKFIARHAELFCAHNHPKAGTCEKCLAFEAREVRSSKNYIHVEL